MGCSSSSLQAKICFQDWHASQAVAGVQLPHRSRSSDRQGWHCQCQSVLPLDVHSELVQQVKLWLLCSSTQP